MKKIVLAALLFAFVLGSIGYASDIKWTLVNETKDTSVYLNLDSISSATLNDKAVKQFDVKLVSKPASDYRTDIVYLNPDNKTWTVIHEERYDNKGKLLNVKESPPTDRWNPYDDPLWKPVLDKVLERR